MNNPEPEAAPMNQTEAPAPAAAAAAPSMEGIASLLPGANGSVVPKEYQTVPPPEVWKLCDSNCIKKGLKVNDKVFLRKYTPQPLSIPDVNAAIQFTNKFTTVLTIKDDEATLDYGASQPMIYLDEWEILKYTPSNIT